MLAHACVRVLRGHADAVHCCQWCSSGAALAVSTSACEAPETAGAAMAVSGGEDCVLHVWDLDLCGSLRVLHGHAGPVWCCDVGAGPHRMLIVSGSRDHTLRVWDLRRRVPGQPENASECAQVLQGHRGSVTCVRWSPGQSDGQYHVVSGSADRTLRVWSAETWRCERVLRGHHGAVNCVEWSESDGGCRWILSGSDDKTLRLWDVSGSEGACKCILEGHTDPVLCCAFSRGENARRWAVSGSWDSTCCLWNCESTADLVVRLAGHTAPVYCCCWSTADGGSRWIATGAYDETLRIWSAQAAICVHVLRGHSRWVRGCAWSSADGGKRWLLSASRDKTLRVWELFYDADEDDSDHLSQEDLVHSIDFFEDLSVCRGTPQDTAPLQASPAIHDDDDQQAFFQFLDILSPNRKVISNGSPTSPSPPARPPQNSKSPVNLSRSMRITRWQRQSRSSNSTDGSGAKLGRMLHGFEAEDHAQLAKGEYTGEDLQIMGLPTLPMHIPSPQALYPHGSGTYEERECRQTWVEGPADHQKGSGINLQSVLEDNTEKNANLEMVTEVQAFAEKAFKAIQIHKEERDSACRLLEVMDREACQLRARCCELQETMKMLIESSASGDVNDGDSNHASVDSLSDVDLYDSHPDISNTDSREKRLHQATRRTRAKAGKSDVEIVCQEAQKFLSRLSPVEIHGPLMPANVEQGGCVGLVSAPSPTAQRDQNVSCFEAVKQSTMLSVLDEDRSSEREDEESGNVTQSPEGVNAHHSLLQPSQKWRFV